MDDPTHADDLMLSRAKPPSLGLRIWLVLVHAAHYTVHFWSHTKSENEEREGSLTMNLPITQTSFAHCPLAPSLLTSHGWVRTYNSDAQLHGLPVYNYHFTNNNHLVIKMQNLITSYPPPNVNTNTNSTHSTTRTRTPLSLGKTILGLTFQAVVGVALASQNSLFSSSSSSVSQPHLLPFLVFGVVMGFAFASSFSGIFLRVGGYHRIATILDYIGYVSTAIGFFFISSTFLPTTFKWICWLACALTLLSFTLPFIPSLSKGSSLH